MIDSQKITDLVLEEARFVADHVSFNDSPTLHGDAKLERLILATPLPEKQHISFLIEEIFWASLLTEEGRPCRPRILYSPRQEPMRRAVHRLAKPVPLNRDLLRKLAPVQGPIGYLIWDCTSGIPEITGVQGREGGDPLDFIVAAPNNGALDISWSCVRILALRAGRLERLSQTSLPQVHSVLEIVRKLTGNFEPVLLRRTIRAIASSGHGGFIWILREGSSVDGIHIGYPVQPDERPLPQHHEPRFKWLESVGYLAAGDGAVLVDSRVRILGFGAFIDVPEAARQVSIAGGAENIESTKLGGGRHRSAIEFCVRFAPAAAIVVSEDGRISVVWAETQADPFYAPFSALGFSDSII